jgi:hypothetical protein
VKGYYRSTRFDWAGLIPSLQYQGHSFFGKWFDRYDPKTHDAVQGPVEEFGDVALGYDEAQPGGVFVKVGVGALRKPEGGRPYSKFTVYDIVDAGAWEVHKSTDSVECVQTLKDSAGYAYVYRKTVRLAKNRPVLTLEHSLHNTGKKPIATSVYDHNFYMLDALPAGPDYVVKFPFAVTATSPRGFGNLAEVSGKELRYLQELQTGQTAQSQLTGFGGAVSDYDIRVENKKAGIGVRQTSDRPIAKINFWSIRTTVCPEAYIDVKVAPGQTTSWRIDYEFYTLPAR